METKKSKKSDIEGLRTVFLQAGTLIAMAAVLIAFEWPTVPGGDNDLLTNRGSF